MWTEILQWKTFPAHGLDLLCGTFNIGLGLLLAPHCQALSSSQYSRGLAATAIANDLVAGEHTQSLYILKEYSHMALLTTPQYRDRNYCLPKFSLQVPLWSFYKALSQLWVLRVNVSATTMSTFSVDQQQSTHKRVHVHWLVRFWLESSLTLSFCYILTQKSEKNEKSRKEFWIWTLETFWKFSWGKCLYL